MFEESNNNSQIWVALISSVGGIATAFGLNKIIPAIIEWFKAKNKQRRERRLIKYREIGKLNSRIDMLEKELERERTFAVQTRSTLKAMLPLMKEIMKDHPNYISLLEQLEKNVFGETTPGDGTQTA